jgi:RNA polymerase sigma-B factor
LESFSTLSLDAELPGSDDGYSLVDTLGCGEPGFDRVVYRESVAPRLRRLPERERRILYLRFFCDMTQTKIADRLGISQMHVSRLISRTCERLQREVDADLAREDSHERENSRERQYSHDRHISRDGRYGRDAAGRADRRSPLAA